jgi:hypothetical protein
LAENLGIAGGSRYCLDHAIGDWVLPVDADDLLTDDAVSLIWRTIADQPDRRIIYSDEDVLIDGRYQSPCLRPDFDPVLLACQSYVNHAIAFHRETGRTLDIYGDRGAEFALDWHTMLLFWRAGHQPAHLPEVIYRWRKHPASISQSGSTFDGSLGAIRWILARIRETAPHSEHYQVTECPIHLNISDLHLQRKPIAPPSIARVRLGRSGARPTRTAPGIKLEDLGLLDVDRGIDQLEYLGAAIGNATASLVLLQGRGVARYDPDGLWDAVKHLELFDDVAVASGRLIGRTGTVVLACPVQTSDGTLVDPAAGRHAEDPGHYSIGLKPHTISVPCIDLLLARREDLLAALAERPAGVSLRNLGCWLGIHAAMRQKRVVYVPLLRGEVSALRHLVGDRDQALAQAWSWMTDRAGFKGNSRLGLAPSHAATAFFQ